MNPRVIALLAAAGACIAARADLNETFSYPDGNLTTVSGGLWNLWNPSGSADAVVSSGVALLNVGTDVVREFPAVLLAPGSATFSADVTLTNLTTDANIFFSPASMPYTTGQNYAQSLGFDFNYTNGTGAIAVYRGNTVITAGTGTFTAGTHVLSGTLTLAGGMMSYTSFLDSNPINSGSFAFTDARGINAVEIYQNTATGNGNGKFDNIVVTLVPEPASMTVIGLGLAALLRRRRK